MFVNQRGELNVLRALRLIQTSLSTSGGGNGFQTRSARDASDRSDCNDLQTDHPPLRPQFAFHVTESIPELEEQSLDIPGPETNQKESKGQQLYSHDSFGKEDELAIHPDSSEEEIEDGEMATSGQNADSQAAEEKQMIQTPTGVAKVLCRKCGATVTKTRTSHHVANHHLKQTVYRCILPRCSYTSRRWHRSDVQRHIKTRHKITAPAAGHHFSDLRRELLTAMVRELELCFPSAALRVRKPAMLEYQAESFHGSEANANYADTKKEESQTETSRVWAS